MGRTREGRSSGDSTGRANTPIPKHCAGSRLWLDDGKPEHVQTPPELQVRVGRCPIGKLYLSGAGALHCGEMKIETPVVDFLDDVVHVRGFTISIPSFNISGICCDILVTDHPCSLGRDICPLELPISLPSNQTHLN
jgi:hypothetical protein